MSSASRCFNTNIYICECEMQFYEGMMLEFCVYCPHWHSHLEHGFLGYAMTTLQLTSQCSQYCTMPVMLAKGGYMSIFAPAECRLHFLGSSGAPWGDCVHHSTHVRHVQSVYTCNVNLVVSRLEVWISCVAMATLALWHIMRLSCDWSILRWQKLP